MLNNSQQDWLFAIGYDIFIQKESFKSNSNCQNYIFDYGDIQNALRGKTYPNDNYSPKRFFVIQMN